MMKGEVHSVYITDITNPSEFYVQVDFNAWEVLEKQLYTYIKSEVLSFTKRRSGRDNHCTQAVRSLLLSIINHHCNHFRIPCLLITIAIYA